MTLALWIGTTLLLGSLCVALLSARATRRGRSFWLADRRASGRLAGASLLATIVGASATLGTTDLVARHGPGGAWFLATALPFLAGLAALAPAIRRSQARSVTDLVGRYGEAPRRLAGALVAVAWIGVLAAQFVALKTLAGLIAPDHGVAATSLAWTVLTLYTVVGGQPAVLRADLAQLIVLGVGLAVPAGWWLLTGGVSPEPGTAPPPPPVPLAPAELVALTLTAGLPYLVGPDLHGRLLTTAGEGAARRAVGVALLGLPPVVGSLLVLGLAARSLGLEPGSGAVLLRLAVRLPSPLDALLLVALVAAIVSSATTILMSGSAALAGALEARARRREPGATGPARRGLVALYGAAAALAGSLAPDLLAALLTGYAVFVSALTAPILFSLLDRPGSRAFTLAALATGGGLGALGRLLRQADVLAAPGEALVLATALASGALLMALGALRSRPG